MMKPGCRFTALSFLGSLAGALPGHLLIPEASAQDAGAFNITEENDSFLNSSDKHYTQGLRLSYGSPVTTNDTLDGLAGAFVLPFDDVGDAAATRFSLFVGQSLFTPTDLSAIHPDPRDRPYAGWLYGGANLYRETPTTLDRGGITIGLVGPGAGGEFVQNNWHKYLQNLLGGAQVAGWGSQLRNEPGLILSEEKKWRYRMPGCDAWCVDVLPEVNASLGNIFTYGAAGGFVRFGRNLGVDWGPPRADPAITGSDFIDDDALGDNFAWYLFAGGEGRVVGRNIFLDGNAFRRGPSVDKNILVGDLTAGLAIVTPFLRGNVSYVRRTKEFATQTEQDEFLSINLGFLF